MSYVDVPTSSRHTLIRLASGLPWPGGEEEAVGGGAILVDETNGFATDFTHSVDAERVAVKTAGTVVASGLDAFYSNAGTSPKMVYDVSGVLGWSPHNMFLNSAAPVTQTVTTVVGQNYTVTIVGSGSMTGSSGAAGVATAGAPLTYTATGTSSIFTKAGTVTQIQMNRGAVATAYIATTAAIKNGLAVDYDPVTHAAKGLLCEPAATNYIFPSSPTAAGGWTVRGTATLTAGQIGPTGATTAVLAENITGTGANDFYKTTTGMGASVRVEPSFFIKRVSTSGTLQIKDATGGVGRWDLDLALLGNGWERVTRAHSGVTITADYMTPAGGGSGLQFFRSAGASPLSFYLEFVQHEVGTISTSPIPTVGATATRAADNYTFLLSTIPALGAEYSIYERFSTPIPTNTRCAIALTDGTANENVMFRASSSTVNFNIVDGGVSQMNAFVGTLVADVSSSATYRVKLNDVAGSVNGSAVSTDATVTLPTVTEVRFGGTGTNAAAIAIFRIQKLMLVPRGWDNATLVAKSVT